MIFLSAVTQTNDLASGAETVIRRFVSANRVEVDQVLDRIRDAARLDAESMSIFDEWRWNDQADGVETWLSLYSGLYVPMPIDLRDREEVRGWHGTDSTASSSICSMGS